MKLLDFPEILWILTTYHGIFSVFGKYPPLRQVFKIGLVYIAVVLLIITFIVLEFGDKMCAYMLVVVENILHCVISLIYLSFQRPS